MDAQYRHMLAERPGIGATGHITQSTRLNFTSLTTTLPMIIVVRRGRKVIQSPNHAFQLEAGEAIAIAPGQVFDFENIPAEDGDYEARWLVLDPEAVAAFGEPGGAQPVAPARLWLRANDGSPVLALSSTVADVSVGPTSSGPTRSSRPGQGASGAGTAAPD